MACVAGTFGSDSIAPGFVPPGVVGMLLGGGNGSDVLYGGDLDDTLLLLVSLVDANDVPATPAAGDLDTTA